MESLIKGIEIFQRSVYPEHRELFERLAMGQNPEVLMITCSDSRIDPSLVTQTKPGELFLIRNAGNIVPPGSAGGGEAATIEYAVKVLGVRNIVICGHTDCGAMKALLAPEQLTNLPALKKWLEPARTARRALEQDPAGDPLRAVIEENVLTQIENLKSHPAVAEALATGALLIVGAVYEIESGEFLIYRPGLRKFVPLSQVSREELLAEGGR